MNLTDITKQIRAFADQLEEQNKPVLATPPVDPYAELKAAHAAGKVIQATNNEGDWTDIDYPPLWNLTVGHYRIKPDAPPFQLPPPPPGMQWHRTDGWKAEDLPPGTRPLVEGEIIQENDEVKNKLLDDGRFIPRFIPANGSIGRAPGRCYKGQLCRTTRPLTFSHAGKSWTYHRPGDPMPCDGEESIEIVNTTGKTTTDDGRMSLSARSARLNIWNRTLGWRYAEPLTREVELGPEDVPPGSEFRFLFSLSGVSWTRLGANANGVILQLPGQDLNTKKNLIKTLSWKELAQMQMQINRSIPLTGKWDPEAWSPCHKTIPQNG